jgi:hypothetical protein
MHPTKHGLRATTGIVRSVARVFVWESNPTRDLGLSDTQRDQMTELLTRHFTDSARSHGRQWEELIEYTIEREMAQGDHYDATTGAEFARRYLAVSDEMRRLTRDVAKDAREFLTPEQMSMVEKNERVLQHVIDGIERRMKRWEKGDVGKDRDPFQPEEDPATSEQQRKQDEREERQLWNEQAVNGELAELSPEYWRRFLVNTEAFFGFTDEQKQKAEKIFADCSSRAQQIMTAEWRARFKRIKLRIWLLSGQFGHRGPMLYRLNKEQKELRGPVLAIRAEFRDKIIDLATDEQRRNMVARIQGVAQSHGVKPDEMEGIETMILHPANGK